MASGHWTDVLFYAPEVAILPAAALGAAISVTINWVRSHIGAWLWRRRAWPKRL